jgi:hypothetical protein
MRDDRLTFDARAPTATLKDGSPAQVAMQHGRHRTVTGDYSIRQNPVTMQCESVFGKARRRVLYASLETHCMNDRDNHDADTGVSSFLRQYPQRD